MTYLVGLAGFGNYLVAFGCTYGLNTVHFHSVGLSVSFAAVSIQYTYRLAPWLLYLLSDLNKCFCLLTGIARCTSLGVRGRCRIRTCCSLKLFRESSPLWSDAVALVSAMGQAFPLIPMLPVCANYSGFYLPKYIYPDFLLSLVIFKNQRTSRRAG